MSLSVGYDTCAFAGCTDFGGPGCGPPQNVGGLVGETVTFTGTPTFFGASLYNDSFGLGANGSWDSGRNGYAGINNQGGTGVFMTFTFADGPVSVVGAFQNYAPGGGGSPIIEALGAGGVVLESFDLSVAAPISTPGGSNQGAFRGIVRATNDIFAIRWRDGFQVIDNLTFSRGGAEVPEPTSLLLIGTGLVGLAGATWRRRQK